MTFNLKIIGLCFVLLLCFQDSTGQADSASGNKYRLGYQAGYGFQSKNFLHPKSPYDYRAYLFSIQSSKVIYKNGQFNIDLFLQAQYNITRYAYDIEYVPAIRNGYEFGAHAGAVFRVCTRNESYGVYLLLFIGPHYISGSLNRQASGFIFSDNMFLGSTVRIYKNIFFDIQCGYRHISPAGLTKPSDGLNNIIISMGINYAF